jgi:hypothetical protein
MNVSIWGRFVSAAQGAITGWNADYNNPVDLGQWDTFTARQQRYTTNAAYYNNTVYDTLSTTAGQLKARGELYRFIRGVRNPAARLVDMYTAKIYGGTLDIETADTGAIPLSCDPKLAQAIIALWKASNWGTNKGLYVERGAMLGDTFILLVNDADTQKICMELIDPVKVREIKKDYQGNFTRVVLEYDVVEDTTQQMERYRYKKIIDLETIATFKNDKPYDYERGVYAVGMGSKWANPYGFVPIAQAQHHNRGLDSGACAFQTSIQKIDELNTNAALLNDQIKKAIQTNWAVAGSQQPRDGAAVDLTANKKDKGNFIYLKEGATITPLVFPLDIVGALANLESLSNELEYDMPELALYKVRAVGLASGVAVKRMYDDAVTRINGAGMNYDDALARAQAMGVAMGAYHKYDAYKSFSVEDYAKGNLYHVIKEREMFDDTLDKQTKLMTLATLKDQPPKIAAAMMRTMDMQEDEIAEIVTALEEKEEKDMEAAARGFGKSMFGDDNGDEEETDKAGSAANARKDTSETQESNRTSGNSSSQ